MEIDYTSLEQQVAAWQKNYVQSIRDNHGEKYVADTERHLKDNPWEALLWFVEDCNKAAQRVA
jgi:hypothetical protein